MGKLSATDHKTFGGYFYLGEHSAPRIDVCGNRWPSQGCERLAKAMLKTLRCGSSPEVDFPKCSSLGPSGVKYLGKI